jgi:hypothetical protein
LVGKHHEAAECCFALEKQESGRCRRLLLPRNVCISERARVGDTLGSPGDAAAAAGLNETLAADEERERRRAVL